jgi:hypothetical protein
MFDSVFFVKTTDETKIAHTLIPSNVVTASLRHRSILICSA